MGMSRDEQRVKWTRMFHEADLTDHHPRPWTWIITVYDGLGIQFIDANGKPVLSDLLREPEDAAYLLNLINELK